MSESRSAANWKFRSAQTMFIGMLFVFLFTTLGWICSADDNIYEDLEIKSISMSRWQPNLIVFWSWLIAAPIAILLACWELGYRRLTASSVLGGIVTFVPALASPLFCCAAMWHAMDRWIHVNEIVANDGRTYVYLAKPMLKGQELALGKLAKRDGNRQSIDVLAFAHTDSPRHWSHLIRPAGVIDDQAGQLLFSPQSWLIGIRHDNRCYLAYDLKADKSIGHDELNHLSPFLLLEAQTELHTQDVDRIAEYMEGTNEKFLGYPKEEHLREGSLHPNEAVRAAAERLLKILERQRAKG
jgi:hypothetical protein